LVPRWSLALLPCIASQIPNLRCCQLRNREYLLTKLIAIICWTCYDLLRAKVCYVKYSNYIHYQYNRYGLHIKRRSLYIGLHSLGEGSGSACCLVVK
jgi:hypothetical protein